MRRLGFLTLLLWACASPKKSAPEIEEVSLGVEVASTYPKYLSEWDFFKEPIKGLLPRDGLFPYEINAPLFSDYAFKARFIKLPKDSIMRYHPTEIMQFPVGTILIKNFYYPDDFKDVRKGRRVLETRLLIREEEEWNPVVYQWNLEQTEATRILLGAQVPIEWKDKKGVLQRISYSIPSQPQCKSCHDMNGSLTPIGPSARQLNRDGQLERWRAEGRLSGKNESSVLRLVSYFDKSEELNDRARAWLEVNCAHCHRREGPAKNSGLYLLASELEEYRLGVNKPPIAAGKGSGGLKHGIVPGKPEQSILVHRIESLEPGEMMPELGRKLTDEEGVKLIKEWILGMEK